MKEVGVTTLKLKDAICEVCGSGGFEALLCNCCKCNDCIEHVYCMSKNLQYIPETWTCDECLLINSSSYEHVADAVGELDVKISFGKDQLDVVPKGEEQGVTSTVSSSVGDDINSDDLIKRILTEASDNCYTERHSKRQCVSTGDSKNESLFRTHAYKALPAASPIPEYGPSSGASHLDEQGKKSQTPPKALDVTINGPDIKVLPTNLNSRNDQTLFNSFATLTDMGACSNAERGRIDNLELKMRLIADELQSLWKKIEKARRI